MKIDWKQVSQSPGYRSLKEAYCKQVCKEGNQDRPMRNKVELKKRFDWVINRAKHHAYHLCVPLEDVLNYWEELRHGRWWYGFYNDSNAKFAKLYPYPKKASPKTLRGLIRRARLGWNKWEIQDKKSRNQRVKRAIASYCHDQREKNGRRVGIKRRWTKHRKYICQQIRNRNL